MEKRPTSHFHVPRRPYERSIHLYGRPRHHEDDRPRSTQFTTLTKSPKEILTTEEAKFGFRPPKAGNKPPDAKTTHRYCEFHGDIGHHTNDCFQLKKRIKAAVQSGELEHLIKDIKGGSSRHPPRRWSVSQGKGIPSWRKQVRRVPGKRKISTNGRNVVHSSLITIKVQRHHRQTEDKLTRSRCVYGTRHDEVPHNGGNMHNLPFTGRPPHRDNRGGTLRRKDMYQ
ncbi:hypothetical protein L1987_02511 [Smallanthus sonchifolius]|uniref:Uncharacterized protein n=1 Tax=Smallanthus sonchifolius TaxID=185202 RepID=A0ACB9K884_9ASTR|nr:hypothetical protein L1987_02511 [Smallanthus sonchifolius]